MNIKSFSRLTALQCFLSLVLAAFSPAKPTANYQVVKPFEIFNRETGETIRREDFAGKVLVIDFIAHWCEPCRRSSPLFREMVEEFRKNGGNKHGVEVVLLTVNVEEKDKELTDNFISEVGFDLVANDYARVGGDGLYAQVRSGNLPHFTIINGVPGNDRTPWQLLCNSEGFYGMDTYVEIIDSVKPTGTESPHIQLEVNYRAQLFHPVYRRLYSGNQLRDFGKTKVGDKGKTQKIVIRNAGTRPLQLSKAGIKGKNRKDFRMRGIGKEFLAPGKSIPVFITHRPTEKGIRKALFFVQTNDPERSQVELRLRGGYDPTLPPSFYTK
jgi:thiol-disulfide isomerase/thioredoxin